MTGTKKLDNDRPNFGWKDLLKAVWYLLGGYRKRYMVLILVLFVAMLYVVVPPFVLGKIVDFFVAYQKGNSLSLFIAYSLGLGITYALVSVVRLTTKRKLGNLTSDVSYKVKVEGFDRLSNFSLKWHDERVTGEKSQKIQNGVNGLKSLIGLFSNTILQSIASVVGVIGVFLFLEPAYVLYFVAYILIFFFLLMYFYKRIQKVNDEYYHVLEKAGGSYVEGLSNVLTLKTLGAVKGFKSKVEKRELLTRKYEYKRWKIGNIQWISFQVFNGVNYSVFLLILGFGIVSGRISPGSVVILFGYLRQLQGSADAVLSFYRDILDSKSAIARLMPIFWKKDTVGFGTRKYPTKWDYLSINDGSFRYRDDLKRKSYDVSGINLKIEKHKKIGIVGKTGSGKSTLSKLIAGLYRLDQGEFKVGKVNYYDIDHDEITSEISLVLQDSEMFNLSLRENITLMRKIGPKLFTEAIKISQLREVANKLPDGLETIIGEKGYHLSGGERQRVGIARAICRNPQVFIFDEATSSLDSRTEKLIYDAIEKKLKKKTIVFIAHRISSLKNVDEIYVFSKGQIVESGTYEKLSEDKYSEFFQTYKSQK